VYKYTQLVLDALRHPKPMKLNEEPSYVVIPLRTRDTASLIKLGDTVGCRVLTQSKTHLFWQSYPDIIM